MPLAILLGTFLGLSHGWLMSEQQGLESRHNPTDIYGYATFLTPTGVNSLTLTP
ncbi:MAG TPA: hypothetical protein QF818_02335 [Prochlorococcaceae cyanobacterium Fu_MAG_72]|nr:hypothetical protein [Prochlorococcaceae cyanobacterium Fu_MAG_72]